MPRTKKLPPCPLNHRAYDNDVWKLGGIARIAGVDLEDTLPKSVKDHPWIGLKVTFPDFKDEGYKDGKILNCIVHPQGKLMFDVCFPDPIPPIHHRGSYGYELVLRDHRRYHEQVHRFFGDEIAALEKGKVRYVEPQMA